MEVEPAFLRAEPSMELSSVARVWERLTSQFPHMFAVAHARRQLDDLHIDGSRRPPVGTVQDRKRRQRFPSALACISVHASGAASPVHDDVLAAVAPSVATIPAPAHPDPHDIAVAVNAPRAHSAGRHTLAMRSLLKRRRIVPSTMHRYSASVVGPSPTTSSCIDASVSATVRAMDSMPASGLSPGALDGPGMEVTSAPVLPDASFETSGIANSSAIGGVLPLPCSPLRLPGPSACPTGTIPIVAPRCSRCDNLGHVAKDCPIFPFPPEEHPDALPGDSVPHMFEIRFERSGDDLTLDGQRYAIGCASGAQNNCLIDTLRQKLGIIASADHVRLRLQTRFASGDARVTSNNFLELAVHWRAVLEYLGDAAGQPIDPNHYRILCIDLVIGHSGDVVGTGPTTLHIARVGLNHFVPPIPRYR